MQKGSPAVRDGVLVTQSKRVNNFGKRDKRGWINIGDDRDRGPLKKINSASEEKSALRLKTWEGETWQEKGSGGGWAWQERSYPYPKCCCKRRTAKGALRA